MATSAHTETITAVKGLTNTPSCAFPVIALLGSTYLIPSSPLHSMGSSLLQSFLLNNSRISLSPRSLLFLQFFWIIPYFLVANYFERSLLFLRLSCYTQSDLLSDADYSNSTPECVHKLFEGQRSGDEECTVKDNLDFLIVPRLPSYSFDTVIVVRSAPKARDYRDYIRRTWMKDTEGYAPVVFVVAKGADLTKESEEHGDILLLNFTDSYYVLSKKMTGTYKWFLSLPHSPTKLVITNDDVVLNTKNLQDLPVPSAESPWIVGKVSRGYPRIIFPWLPWFVSNTEYPQLCYPKFVQGSSMVVSRPAASLLLDRSCDIPLLRLDDVWMGALSLCLPFKQIHREGFDVHWPDQFFVVFHHQFERYSPDRLEQLYERSRLS